MLSSRIFSVIPRRLMSGEPPKKFKNFAETQQSSSASTTSTPTPPPTPKKEAPAPAPKPSPVHSAPSGQNKPAGNEYLVPEYSQHNEYTFFDLNTDMLSQRMPQPSSVKS